MENTSPAIRKKWESKLRLDINKVVLWKRFPASKKTVPEIKTSLDKFSWKRDAALPYDQRRIDKGFEKAYSENLAELNKRTP